MKKLIILLIATMLFTTKVYGIKSRNLVGGIEARDCNYCFLSENNSQKFNWMQTDWQKSKFTELNQQSVDAEGALLLGILLVIGQDWDRNSKISICSKPLSNGQRIIINCWRGCRLAGPFQVAVSATLVLNNL